MRRWISDGMGGFHLPDGGRLISDGMGGFIEAAGSGGGLAGGLAGLLAIPVMVVVLGGMALIFGIVFVSPFAAIYYGFLSPKFSVGAKILIWIYLGIYLVVLWFVATAALVPLP